MNKTGPNIEIFSQGEEVVTGQTVDSNAAWIARQLIPMGFNVTRHSVVGDRRKDLVALLHEIAGRADGCICSGGLGPTEDDLTAEAVSEAFGLPLELDAFALECIEQYFAHRARAMPAVNRKQAMLPKGSRRLDNDWGTAPGFAVDAGGCWFAFLPGVPSEMRNMFRERVKPELSDRFTAEAWKQITVRTVGLGESTIQEKLDGLAFPEELELGFRSGVHDIQTKLLFPASFPDTAVQSVVTQVADALGSAVYGIDGFGGEEGSLPAVIGCYLAARKQTVAMAETLTAGTVSGLCAAESAFPESIVMNDVSRLLERFGVERIEGDAQSAFHKAARDLSQAVRTHSGTDHALVQLWAEAKTDDVRQSVVHLYNALATPDNVFQSTGQVRGERGRQRNAATTRMLDLLRRYLQGLL